MANKKSFHETVAANLIERLEQGTAPWQKPWTAKEQPNLPYNPTSNKRYRGINTLNLMIQGYSDPRWLTYNQAAALDAQVQKGEKSTLVQYWKFSDEKNKTDENGKVVKDENNKPIKIRVNLERPKVFYASVFNAEQIQGLPPLAIQEKTDEQQWQDIERAEKLLINSGANIKHDQSDRAFYTVGRDTIHLPEKDQFNDASLYYATALHELGHWTGHPSRLDRPLNNPFGSEAYAKEELRAEISSMILGEELGIGHDPSQHTAYVKSWVKTLKNDPLEIFRAAADAEKILTHVLGFEHSQEAAMTHEPVLGTDAAKSWENIKETAEQAGLIASLTASTDSELSPYTIIYHFQDGNLAPVQTALLEDGKALTHTEKETINDKGFTLDLEKQKDEALIALTVANKLVSKPKVNDAVIEKVFLDVPYKDKDEAKALGARWDKETSHWFISKEANLTDFIKWPTVTPSRTKHFLAVPYEERNEAKKAGAKWDKKQSAWFVNVDKGEAVPANCAKWLPDNQTVESTPQPDAREEFADKLSFMGFELTGEHPIMDGQKHRCRVETDKNGVAHKAGAGMYVADLNGHPWGYAINNKTGEETKWKAKGYSLSPSEKAKYQAQAAQNQLLLKETKDKEQSKVAAAITRLVAVAVPAIGNEKYIVDKQISTAKPLRVPSPGLLENDPDLLIGENWKASKALREANPDKLVFTTGELLIPATNSNGEIRTAQTIQNNGTKMFPRGGQKTGTFNVVGGNYEDLERTATLIITEGFATADTLAEASKQPVISAFDAGNVIEIAKELRRKFPTKPILIAGDDDVHLELTEIKGNVGRNKATDAAEVTGGTAIFPIFAPKEASYPSYLDSMNPTKWRNNEATDEQKHAISEMKRFTDFNDLKVKSEFGIDGVKRQLCAMLNRIHDKEQALQSKAKTKQKSHSLSH